MATIDTRKGPDGKVVYRARIRRKGYPTQTGTFPTRSEAKKWITMTNLSALALARAEHRLRVILEARKRRRSQGTTHATLRYLPGLSPVFFTGHHPASPLQEVLEYELLSLARLRYGSASATR